MAEIIPFKGILYNPKKIADLSGVVAPPYDVISPQLQERLHRKHPCNVIRLILGKTESFDTISHNRYTRAAKFLETWQADNILVRDEVPAFYLSAVDFFHDGHTITRYGLIALVRIEPFEKGIILPHERTFSKVKYDRFELMKACHANFSPIFSLYSDQNGILHSLKNSINGKKPHIDLIDNKGLKRRFWRITDPDVHQFVVSAMTEKIIFIADGHHRYETALNYRNWISERTPDFSDNHPANYVMMSLISIEDPGLVILPAHRLLSEVGDDALEMFLKNAEEYFEIEQFPFHPENQHNVRSRFIHQLQQNSDRHCIGVFIKNSPIYHLLKLKPGIMTKMFSQELPEPLRKLDVSVLTRLIFMEILGFDQKRLDNEKLISYASCEDDALDAVHFGQYDVSFILNPTKIEQVQQIAQKGFIMPRKSTYFYPKVVSGQVLNSLLPE
jgi:uncharacterized protein (DUF1015 family)